MNKIVLYIPYAYPSRESFFKILYELDCLGVFGVEIGLPDKNPFLDGERIKDIHHKVLKKGFCYSDFEDDILTIYKTFSFKTIIMGYSASIDKLNFNRITDYYDGIIVVDKEGYPKQIPVISKSNLNSFIPEDYKNSLFHYVISGEGKTGSFSLLPDEFIETIKVLRRMGCKECFVGFGIKNRNDVNSVLTCGADGAIVGTSFLKYVNNIDQVKDFVQDLL